MSLNRVIIKDTFSGVGLVRALSYIGAFVALAPALAPALGGFIEMHWGWRWIFGFLLIYCLILGILMLFTLPETHRGKRSSILSLGGVMRNYRIITQNRYFWANVLCSGLAFSAMIVCATINPFLAENSLGKTPAQYGVLVMICAVGFLIGMLTNTSMVTRFGSERTLRTGNLLILVMGASLIITGYLKILTIEAILIPTIGVGLGIAWVFPNAFNGAITPFPAMAGAAGALYGCIQIAISFVASAAVALVSETTQLPMGILLFCTASLGLILFPILNQPPQNLDIGIRSGGH
jgi:predicted MFS family arabinose efflux permease